MLQNDKTSGSEEDDDTVPVSASHPGLSSPVRRRSKRNLPTTDKITVLDLHFTC